MITNYDSFGVPYSKKRNAQGFSFLSLLPENYCRYGNARNYKTMASIFSKQSTNMIIFLKESDNLGN